MTLFFYIVAIIALIISYINSEEKTKMVLKKAWKAFENILPQFLVILFIIGMMLAVLIPEDISKILGKEAGIYGVIGAAFIGAITLIHGFVVFPLVTILLRNGAGVTQIAVFVSSLMMVGIVTMPVEIKYFGKKVTFYRNGLAFIFSLIVAFAMGRIL